MPVPVIIAGAAAAGGGAAAGGAAVAAGSAAAAGTTAAVGTAAAGGAAASAGTAAAKQVLTEEMKKKLKEEFEKKLKEELKNKILDKVKSSDSDASASTPTKTDDKYKKPKKGDSLDKKGNLDNKNNGKNNNKNSNNNNNNKNSNNKNNPLKDAANSALDKGKEAAKDAAAKAGGAALKAATGGVLPTKLGEKISKKALDKGENLLKKSKNRMPNTGLNKNALNNLKNNIKDKLDEGKQKAKSTVDKGKKAIKTALKIRRIKKALPIILGVIAAIIIISIPFVVYGYIETLLPGINGDVKEEEVVTDNYSKRDQKVLDKIEGIVNKNPNTKKYERPATEEEKDNSIQNTGDDSSNTEESEDIETDEEGVSVGAVAMSVVAYPYYDILQSGELRVYSETENKTEEDDENEEDGEEFSFGETNGQFEEDEGDSEEDEEENDDENDMYLDIFAKRKYRKKFKKLMEVYNDKGPEGFDEYLKTDYFKSEKAYKKLLKKVPKEDEEQVYNDLIDEIVDNAELFETYIPVAKCYSTSNLTSLGNSGNTEIKGEIYVSLRDYFATNGTFIVDDYYASPILYGTDVEPLNLKRYVMGVAYAESESCAYNESCAKTMMIVAKSFAVGRQKGMGYKTEYYDDKTILHMRGNVGDQDFCDVYEGCNSGKYSKGTWSKFTGEGYNSRKGAMSSEHLANLEKWYDETANEFLTKSDGTFAGNQYSDYNSNCKKGSCLSQTVAKKSSEKETDYKNILFNPSNGGFDNSKYVLYNVEDGNSYVAETSSVVGCASENCGVSGTRDEIVTFARSMVGKISYYFGGKPSSPNYEDNNFGTKVSPDHKGRSIKGLDCSGFVDFVFWHVMNENFGLGNTSEIRDKYSEEIDYDDLKPGDIGFLDKSGSGTNQHVGIYVGKDEKGADLWIDCNPSGVVEHNTTEFKVYYRPKVLNNVDDNVENPCITSGQSRLCKTYNLSDSDINDLASVAYKEQGSVEGARAEASLMANRFELHGGKYSSIKDYVHNSGWFASSSFGGSTPKKEVVEAVKDVFVNGNRSFPSYVDEHDCISCGNSFDIVKLELNGKTYTSSKDLLDHSNYVQDKTIIHNRYDSKYTFYSFPTKNSDPFGYTKKLDDTCMVIDSGVSVSDTNGAFAPVNHKNGEHTGQCIIYAQNRAAEIIKSAKVGYDGISNRSKYVNVWTSGGFGGAKCALSTSGMCQGNSKSSQMKKLFVTSTDVNKPQAGAAIVWDNTSKSKYGHIAIVEQVHKDGTITISQSNWCSNCEKFTTNKLTKSQMKNYGNHKFIGYIYLLQPKK